MIYYVAMDIGCIECGEASSCLGIFTEKATADAACDKAREEQQKKWGGQHGFEVFEVGALDAVVIPVYGRD